MSYKSFICPKCNTEVMLDESRDFGFCSECGTKITIEHRPDSSYTYGEAENNAQNNSCNNTWRSSNPSNGPPEDNSMKGMFLRSVKFWK